jgi:hypothetical protein
MRSRPSAQSCSSSIVADPATIKNPRHDAIRRTNHADVDQGDMLAGHSTERTHQQLRRAAARTASEDVSSEDPDFPQWFFHSRPD